MLSYGAKINRLSNLFPQFERPLYKCGFASVAITNLSGFDVTVGLRSGNRGKDFIVPSNSYSAVSVCNNKYDIYFVFSNEPDTLYQGDNFPVKESYVFDIKLANVVYGNYHIRQVNKLDSVKIAETKEYSEANEDYISNIPPRNFKEYDFNFPINYKETDVKIPDISKSIGSIDKIIQQERVRFINENNQNYLRNNPQIPMYKEPSLSTPDFRPPTYTAPQPSMPSFRTPTYTAPSMPSFNPSPPLQIK
ncbi:MAG: hypothetical protein HY758_09080 [Nitrospirae bacterium]|nr:hypothetical protein [Nitrospirota bacterium]